MAGPRLRPLCNPGLNMAKSRTWLSQSCGKKSMSQFPNEGRSNGSRLRTVVESPTCSRVRLTVRCLALFLVIIAIWLFPSSARLAATLVAVSPFVAVGSTLAVKAIGWTTLLAAPVLLIAFFRRRWFCRWLCPTGLLCEATGGLIPRRRMTTSAAATKLPRRTWNARPWRLLTKAPLGHWFALLTFGGAVFGYSLFLWLDPLALLAAFVGASWDEPLATTTLLSALGLVAVLGLSLFAPGVWCMRVCPLGATQELLSALRQALPFGTKTPAIREETRLANKTRDDGWPLARRVVLAGGLGAAWAWVVRPRVAAAAGVIRPPGAIDEIRFRAVCVRCGNCLRACPTSILRPDLGENGLSGLLCPKVGFEPGYCREDCHRCGEACPSGAIAWLATNEKKTARMGLATVDIELCLLTDNHECNICRNCCPYEAIATVWSEEEYTLAVRVDSQRCTGCGACQVACPTAPRKAIMVRPLR